MSDNELHIFLYMSAYHGFPYTVFAINCLFPEYGGVDLVSKEKLI